MVHALRQALASKLVTDGKKCPVSALDSKYAGDEHVILCHTPHFLDYPDRHGAERGTQRVTAYYTSGRF